MYEYIANFEKLGFGMFVHFGLYSILGKGEWAKEIYAIPDEEYNVLAQKFKVKKTWAKELVQTAKSAGCKYITLTTRHHDGFSLFDACGLNDFDAVHSASGRDLIREFVDACREGGILPMFYHTLLDWYNKDFYNDFPKYLDYLYKSVELLCTRYGKIGGLWFDGMWARPNDDWQEDRLYSMIRRNQPEAMIINNTGLSELGKVGHPMLDSVTFERGNPAYVDNSDRPRAGEMCQVLNDHWGYAKHDCNYKSTKELIENLVDCRRFNCNFLLNVGLTGNGSVKLMDKALLGEIGAFVKATKGFIYASKRADITAENADVLYDGKYYYAVIKDVPMSADPNVQLAGEARFVTVHTEKKVRGVRWLDNGKPVAVKKNRFSVVAFAYGNSYSVRVARFELA